MLTVMLTVGRPSGGGQAEWGIPSAAPSAKASQLGGWPVSCRTISQEAPQRPGQSEAKPNQISHGPTLLNKGKILILQI